MHLIWISYRFVIAELCLFKWPLIHIQASCDKSSLAYEWSFGMSALIPWLWVPCRSETGSDAHVFQTSSSRCRFYGQLCPTTVTVRGQSVEPTRRHRKATHRLNYINYDMRPEHRFSYTSNLTPYTAINILYCNYTQLSQTLSFTM